MGIVSAMPLRLGESDLVDMTSSLTSGGGRSCETVSGPLRMHGSGDDGVYKGIPEGSLQL